MGVCLGLGVEESASRAHGREEGAATGTELHEAGVYRPAVARSGRGWDWAGLSAFMDGLHAEVAARVRTEDDGHPVIPCRVWACWAV